MLKQHTSKFSGVTWRSVLVGTIAVIILSISSPYVNYALRGSYVTANYLPLGVVFLFFVLVGGVNVLLKYIRAEWAFTSSELVTIFVMLIVSAAIPTNALTGLLVSTLAAPFYYATPENRWAEFLDPYIPKWMAPRDPEAIRQFWEGLSPGASIPWNAWLLPLAMWLSFAAVLIFVCLCVVVILRKQWVEKERLTFPLAQVPFEMMREEPGPKPKWPALMKNSLFWIGFAIPAFILSWNCLSEFYPFLGKIATTGSAQILPAGHSLSIRLYFPIIGYAYLINLDVSLSIWLFHILIKLQEAMYAQFGFSLGAGDNMYSYGEPAIEWQGYGAFILFVLVSLWMARSHIRDVFRKAFTGDPTINDSEEFFSYRVAVFGLILGVIFLVGWLIFAGMSPLIAIFLLAIAGIAYLGVTKVVIDSGLVYLRSPVIAPSFTAYALVTKSFTPSTFSGLAFSYIWTGDLKALIMPAFAHAAKLGSIVKMRLRSLLKPIALAVFLAVVLSLWYTLYICYSEGALNFHGVFVFRGGATFPFEDMVNKLRNPIPADLSRLSFLGLGGTVMGGLMFFRYRFAGWPVHPIGFALARLLPIELSWFSVFIAWFFKMLILKYGGVKLFRRVRPFFFGLILGQFAAAGFWTVVDMFSQVSFGIISGW